MSGNEGLHGVGGWLAFFIFAFGILSPLVALFSVWTSLYGPEGGEAAFGDAWAMLQLFEWTLFALSLAAMWFVVWRLIKIHLWASVRLAITVIWLVGPAMVFVETGGISLLLGLPFGELLAAYGLAAVEPFIFAIVWTAYFLRSERVANTYPRYVGEAEVAKVFG